MDGVIEPQAFARTMAERIGQLGNLGWELTAGGTSEHALVITAEGDPVARAVARRVVLAAPDAGATWSYLDSRPPAPDPDAVVLSADGSQAVDLSRVQVTARLNRGRFDVLLHHPSFADLPEESRLQITFRALGAALGEVDTELWLGEVQPVEFPPLDGFSLSALRAVVRDLKSQRLDEDGKPGWAMLRGETKEGPLVAMARTPLHALTAPNLDTYVAVVLPYRHRTDEGLPGKGSLEPLAEFERRLDRQLGGSGQVVAHTSTAGVRTLHLYVDSAADVLPQVKGLARSWGQGSAKVHDMPDPGWSAVSHLRT